MEKELQEKLEKYFKEVEQSGVTESVWAGFKMAFLGITDILNNHIVKDGGGSGCPQGFVRDPQTGKCVPDIG